MTLGELEGTLMGSLNATGPQALAPVKWRVRSAEQRGHELVARYLSILGGPEGRVQMALRSVPEGTVAITIPRKRGGQIRVPRDRRGRIVVREVDLVAEAPTDYFTPPKSFATKDLIWVLSSGRRLWRAVENRFGAEAQNVALALVRVGAIRLQCAVADLVLGAPASWQLSPTWMDMAPAMLAELKPVRDVDVVRKELAVLLADVPEDTPLAGERFLLSQVKPGAPLAIPTGGVTSAKRWGPYEAALRAAAVYFALDRKPWDVELAGRAWRDTHTRWTPARRKFFSELIGMDFEQAVKRADTGIRIRGPLSWHGDVPIADALPARPWIELPLNGMELIGELESSAVGVLVIENADTFEEVAANQAISDRWLCLWGKGKAVVDTVRLIKRMPEVPVAAWMDLDAQGLSIFRMFRDDLGREVTPVGMDLTLLVDGIGRQNAKKDMTEEDMKLASSLVGRLPGPLADVAGYIARTGKAVEQQVLHSEVLPGLPSLLDSLLPPG